MQLPTGGLSWVIDYICGEPLLKPGFVVFEPYVLQEAEVTPTGLIPAKIIRHEPLLYARVSTYSLAASRQLQPMMPPLTANVRLLPLKKGVVRLGVRVSLVDPQLKCVEGLILRTYQQTNGTLQILSSELFELKYPREQAFRFEDDYMEYQYQN